MTHFYLHTCTQGFDLVPEDSVVPHTPVLNKGKQLAMGSRIQTLYNVFVIKRVMYVMKSRECESLRTYCRLATILFT